MMRRFFVILAILLASAALLDALTLTGPSWSPSSAYTNDTLNCSWTLSGDTTLQNITVLNGTIVYNNTFQNVSQVNLSTHTTVPGTATLKGQTWWCRVELFNDTASTMQNDSIVILNSAPTTEGADAGVFNDTYEDVGFLVQIAEDTSMNLDVNATDADGDTLTYNPASDFCSLQSSSEGTYICSPTNSDITNNQPTQVNISFTVSDGQNIGGRTITFNITPVNDAPTATLTNQETAVNVSLNYTFTASDEEEHYPLNASLFFNGSNSEIQDKMSIALLVVNGTSLSIYYDGSTPDFNDVGYWPIYINLTDSQNLSSLLTYNFNITAVGRQPYFNTTSPAGPYYIQQGQFQQINITANDPDANSTLTFLDDTSRFAISTVKADTNTSDAIGQINFTPTNDDVGVYNVTITIVDSESLQNTTILEFNVTNVNDPPTINELSYSTANTQSNQNASNLTAYENAPFVYDVNATDPDTQYGDSLNYTDNSSLFTINLTTGRISFTPSSGDVQASPYHINITATDESGVQDSRVISLQINGNSPPYFNLTLPQLNCTADIACLFNAAAYTTDPDAGDNVSFYNVTFNGTNLSSFSYNETTGLFNFTPTKSEVGNYSINLTIEDSFGASNVSSMTIVVNNTPVAPNLTRFNFSSETIVENKLFTYQFIATDEDFLVPNVNENVTFTTNLSLTHQITPQTTTNTTTTALFSFTPGASDAGNYTIQINATDTFGLVDSQVITFEVLGEVPPPNITEITPWGESPGFAIQTSYRNVSLLSNNSVTVVVAENTTVFFDVNVNDTRPLTYNWSLNGTQIAETDSTSGNYTRFINFTSAGTFYITVNVSNDRLEQALFSWNVDVTNVNRGPILRNNLQTPLVVNTTSAFSDYFTFRESQTKFIDPDDDTDNSSALDGNETNTLTFSTQSSCSVASLTISGDDLTVTPTEVGTCQVVFNATDAESLTLESNTVLINVTDVPEEETTTTTTSSSSSGGGGGGGSSSIVIPLNSDPEPEAFKLIAPKLVTIYNNDTLTIPITINNTWEEDLNNVSIFASANVSDVSTEMSQETFPLIPVNGSEEVLLIVSNYRLGENYEVLVYANVSDPEYDDEALILLNSIEQANEGDQVKVKVTFANDLLSQHSECQELQEILSQAETELRGNNVREASRLVDGVISGCKYLVSTQQRIDERPGRINPIITIDQLSLKAIMWSVLAFVLLVSIALMAYYHYSSNPDEDF